VAAYNEGKFEVVCPDCGASMESGLNECPFCGALLGGTGEEEAQMKCPDCDAPIDPGLDECPYCGALTSVMEKALEKKEVKRAPAPPPPPRPKEKERKPDIVCTECGAILEPNMTECPDCGMSVEKMKAAKAEPEEEVQFIFDGKREIACPYCFNSVEPGVSECPFCGESLGGLAGAEVSGDKKEGLKAEEQREPPEKPAYIECPDCGSRIEPDLAECPNCGAVIRELAPPTVEEERKLEAGEGPITFTAEDVECPDCGTLVEPELNECPYCGAVLREASREAGEAKAEEKKWRVQEDLETLCPDCGAIVDSRFDMCPECGAEIGGLEEEGFEEGYVCPECGQVYTEPISKCSQCDLERRKSSRNSNVPTAGPLLPPGTNSALSAGLSLNKKRRSVLLPRSLRLNPQWRKEWQWAW
jgi:RNA polymerase subunit RPABC4/transcription elongation factor Spt4